MYININIDLPVIRGEGGAGGTDNVLDYKHTDISPFLFKV